MSPSTMKDSSTQAVKRSSRMKSRLMPMAITRPLQKQQHISAINDKVKHSFWNYKITDTTVKCVTLLLLWTEGNVRFSFQKHNPRWHLHEDPTPGTCVILNDLHACLFGTQQFGNNSAVEKGGENVGNRRGNKKVIYQKDTHIERERESDRFVLTVLTVLW